MVASLSLATILGAVLGYQYRVAALVLVLAALVIGGVGSGLSLLQICAAALMVQVGYIVCSCLRVFAVERAGELARDSEFSPED